MRAGMTVQQHHRLPLAAVPDAERHLTDIDAIQLEAVKHEPRLAGQEMTASTVFFSALGCWGERGALARAVSSLAPSS